MNFDISQLQTYQWVLGVASGLVIGMAKTGLSGLTLFFIPLMAISFGGRASTGIILPMLCVGDIFAVAWYRHHGEDEIYPEAIAQYIVRFGGPVSLSAAVYPITPSG